MSELDPEKLVLLDRDGVINFDSDDYIKSAEEWLAIPGSLETIAKLNQRGVDVIVITNQSGIGRGLFSERELAAMHEKMFAELAKFGGNIKDIFYCPHKPDDYCNCRKPKPGLLDQLEEKYKVSLESVPYVGDTSKDLALASSKHCLPVLVKTGKGLDYYNGAFKDDPVKQHTLVFDDLEKAGNYLLEENF